MYSVDSIQRIISKFISNGYAFSHKPIKGFQTLESKDFEVLMNSLKNGKLSFFAEDSFSTNEIIVTIITDND